MFFVNIIWQHLLAAILSNWGTTLNGLLGAAITAAAAAYPIYAEGKDFQHTNWALFGMAVWIGVWNALRAKFSWASILGAMLRGAPRAQLADMTKENTTKP
jgi:hypothetical protein